MNYGLGHLATFKSQKTEKSVNKGNKVDFGQQLKQENSATSKISLLNEINLQRNGVESSQNLRVIPLDSHTVDSSSTRFYSLGKCYDRLKSMNQCYLFQIHIKK